MLSDHLRSVSQGPDAPIGVRFVTAVCAGAAVLDGALLTGVPLLTLADVVFAAVDARVAVAGRYLELAEFVSAGAVRRKLCSLALFSGRPGDAASDDC